MGCQRVFLGWSQALLPRMAGWLLEHAEGDAGSDAGAQGTRASGAATGSGPGVCDLSSVIVVVPGARAGRRLLELLTTQCMGDDGHQPTAVLFPPQITTLSHLPEHLYEPAQPRASALEQQLAWIATLREMDTASVTALLPHPPAADNLRAWMGLAQDLMQLHQALNSDGVTPADVQAKLDSPLEQARWAVLDILFMGYHTRLAAAGRMDPLDALTQAIAQGCCRCEHRIVLAGVTDMPRLHRRMLEAVADQVTALVPVPPAEAQAFDDMGVLRVDAWHDRHLIIPEAQVHIVTQAHEQADAVVQTLAQPSIATQFSREQITVGLCDEALAAAIERRLTLAGVPARSPRTMPLAQTRPMMLLVALARFISTQRFDAFAALLRHPDIEAALLADTAAASAADNGSASDTARGIEDWLHLLDRYANDHLQSRLIGPWLGEQKQRLKHVHNQVLNLMPEELRHNPNLRRPLHRWPTLISQTMTRVYASHSLDRGRPADRMLVEALEVIVEALREQVMVSEDHPLSTALSLPEVVDLLGRQLGDASLSPVYGEPAVELLGWLELPLDDAPVLVITAMNEGLVPQSRVADAFLPDSLRQRLGMMCNRQRMARDVLNLHLIWHNRPHVRVLASRYGREQEPLAPSRLLLARPADKLPGMIHQFYQGDEDHAASAAPLLFTPGRNRFGIPQPTLPDQPITQLPVSAFRAYLACPYRFYLRYVLKLRGLDDRITELDAAAFGSLAHDVLEQLMHTDLARETDPEQLRQMLGKALDDCIENQYGREPSTVIQLQALQLRSRLDAFAQVQAGFTAEGWQIQKVEHTCQATLDVDGEPFLLTGRIDRIDVHREHGIRLIDYKTSDSRREPDKTHRIGSGPEAQWVDLQLPLYTLLADQSFKLPDVPRELGYICLPKKLEDVGYAPALWTPDEIDVAIETARGVIRSIRAGIYWPPADPPPSFSEEFEGICLDHCPGQYRVGAGEGAR